MAGEHETVTARIALTIAGTRLEANLTVPSATVPLSGVLHVLHEVSDAVIGGVVTSVETQGRSISCRQGCAACCRQLVPLPKVEALWMRDLVENLPEPRRSTVKARFADAIRRLDEAGLLERLRAIDSLTAEEKRVLGNEYFVERVDCPFLEEELCSIFSDRPFVCREYLVTSPEAFCQEFTTHELVGVEMPVQIWPQVARMGEDPNRPRPLSWVPLVLAMEWAEAHREGTSERPAPEWIEDFFERLSGKSIPPANPEGAAFAEKMKT